MGDATRDGYGLPRLELPGRRGSTWVAAGSRRVDTCDPSAVPACDDAYERHQAAALAALHEPSPAAADGRTDPTAGDGANEPSRPVHGAHSGPARFIEPCRTRWRGTGRTDETIRADCDNGAPWHRCVWDYGLHVDRHVCRCGAVLDTVASLLDPPSEPIALRVWNLPPEPGAEVTAVRDGRNRLWVRGTGGHAGFWVWRGFNRAWIPLLLSSHPVPLTDASGEA
jgi:hypothetical protein